MAISTDVLLNVSCRIDDGWIRARSGGVHPQVHEHSSQVQQKVSLVGPAVVDPAVGGRPRRFRRLAHDPASKHIPSVVPVGKSVVPVGKHEFGRNKWAPTQGEAYCAHDRVRGQLAQLDQCRGLLLKRVEKPATNLD
jgi:hypothetical protein